MNEVKCIKVNVKKSINALTIFNEYSSFNQRMNSVPVQVFMLLFIYLQ